MNPWLRAHGSTAFLGLACVALSGQVVALSLQKRALERRVAEGAADPRAGLFRVGERLASFELRTADGSVLDVRFDGGEQRTLLLVSASACPVCPEVVPRWEEVAPHFLASGTRVVGVLMDRVEERGGAWLPDVPLGSFVDSTRVPLGKLRTVPLTLLMNGEGVIEWLHYGTLTDGRVAELMGQIY